MSNEEVSGEVSLKVRCWFWHIWLMHATVHGAYFTGKFSWRNAKGNQNRDLKLAKKKKKVYLFWSPEASSLFASRTTTDTGFSIQLVF